MNNSLTRLASTVCQQGLRDHQQARTFSTLFHFSGVWLDCSKQFINDAVWLSLFSLADERNVSQHIHHLLSGFCVNQTETKPALHSVLRTPKGRQLSVSGIDVVPRVHHELDKIEQIVHRLHQKHWRGFSGKAITDVVNIGVGGSDLGPFMACQALEEFAPLESRKIRLHFVSSMDGTQIHQVLRHLNPETTLFLVSSKSFSTVDTFHNADTAISWMLEGTGCRDLVMRHHVIGISANARKMTEWGVPETNQLLFWDWVGGRFSMWSAIGLPIAIRIGMDNFRSMLKGAHQMDEHFANAPLNENLPVIMGLIGVWNASYLGINAHTVLPYDGRLKHFPSYLSQLEMESNGKGVTNQGLPVALKTCPILWGDVGPNAQHAFYQLLHQGTQDVSCDFIAPIKRYHNHDTGQSREFLEKQHKLALANCLAQSRVLAFGDDALEDDQRPAHKRYRGNQPSTTILMDELTPESLGKLVALYEHKVYVMAVLWDINPFDQWGVELGKVMAEQTLAALNSETTESIDPSTDALLKIIKTQSKVI